jgi:hypothetical protein
MPAELNPIQPSSAALQNAPGVIVPECRGGPAGAGGVGFSVVGTGAAFVVVAGAGAGLDVVRAGFVAAAVAVAVGVTAPGTAISATLGEGDASTEWDGEAGAPTVGADLGVPLNAPAIADPPQQTVRTAATTMMMVFFRDFFCSTGTGSSWPGSTGYAGGP